MTSPHPVDNFEELLNESFKQQKHLHNTIISGTVIAIVNDQAIIDVGLKSEGLIPLKELSSDDPSKKIQVGDTFQVFIERFENQNNVISLSRDKARREEAWNVIDSYYKEKKLIEGFIFNRVKGGFSVNILGATAFLPGSQIDIRPIQDMNSIINVKQPFQILKMDHLLGNIVVSRRSVLEESRTEERQKIISELYEGQTLKGIVKNITNYGAFIDLGGIDGLLHVTDISWKRIFHPSEVLSLGQTLEVKVIRFNAETQRISLGLKQLLQNPWESDSIITRYAVGEKYTRPITNITDYGAFVELEPGIEGLVHVSELSWSKKNIHPSKLLSVSQEIEVMILEIDIEKKRIKLGLKQCLGNPWEKFLETYPEGSIIQGHIKNITEFGLFINLSDDIDGMIHLSDLSWEIPAEEAIKQYQKDDLISAKVISVHVKKGHVGLGIKQLTNNPHTVIFEQYKKNDNISCIVHEIHENGVSVKIKDSSYITFIRQNDLSMLQEDKIPARLKINEEIQAKILSLDPHTQKITLSIKALEMEEHREAQENYSQSNDTRSSLGDVFEEAMEKKEDS